MDEERLAEIWLSAGIKIKVSHGLVKRERKFMYDQVDKKFSILFPFN